MDVVKPFIDTALYLLSTYYRDLLIIALLLLFVIYGANKGLIKTVSGFVAMIVSLTGASWLAHTMSATVATIIQPRVTERIYMQIVNGETTRYRGLDSYTDELLNMASETAKQVLSAMIRDMLESLVYVAIFVISFVLLLFIVSLLLKPLDLAAKLPVVGQINRIGGGIFGLVRGIVLLYLFVWAATWFGWLAQDTIQRSLILTYCSEHSLIEVFTSFFN